MYKPFSILVAVLILGSNFTWSQTTDSLRNEVSVGTEYYYFDWPINNEWNIFSLDYKRSTKYGPVIGRVSYADRGISDGVQIEVESYPKLSKKVYSYFNLGYSPNEGVFPSLRGGAGVYYSPFRSWEIEGGARVLHFDKSVVIGVFGLSKYHGNYLFNARSFISGRDGSLSQSYFLSARKYFGEKNNYVMLQIGTGTSPDENRNLLLKSREIFSSKRLNAMVNFFPGKHHKLLFNAGFSREQFIESHTSNLFQVGIAYGYRF